MLSYEGKLFLFFAFLSFLVWHLVYSLPVSTWSFCQNIFRIHEKSLGILDQTFITSFGFCVPNWDHLQLPYNYFHFHNSSLIFNSVLVFKLRKQWLSRYLMNYWENSKVNCVKLFLLYYLGNYFYFGFLYIIDPSGTW